MARTFKHLSFEQKLSLKEMLDGGYPIAEIAQNSDTTVPPYTGK